MATDEPSPGALTQVQLSTLIAVVDRILPTGDDGAGALEAGAHRFVERSLRDRLSPQGRANLLEGLGLIDDMARELYGKEYAGCSVAVRDALLQQISEVPHALPWRFLALLVNLTLRGYLCDPRHGGNRDHLGWRLMGLDPAASE